MPISLSASTRSGLRTLRRTPRPLAFLLCAVGLVGFAWAMLVPPFQAPDEPSHFAYVQSIAESFRLPGQQGRRDLTFEQELAANYANSDQTAAISATKPEWSKDVYEEWRAADRRLPRSAREDSGGPNPASANPPLYYLYEAPAYVVASSGHIFARVYALRLWSVLLLLFTATGSWLLAGELFGKDRTLQLIAAAMVGLQPMVVFVTASVNPDGLLYALWALALWLGVRILRRGLTFAQGVALFAVVGLAVVTKATGYALLPGCLLVLAIGTFRRRRAGAPALAVTCAAVMAFVIPAGAWLATAHALDRPAINKIGSGNRAPTPTLTSFSVRKLGSYLWQFYLPRLPFQKRYGGLPNLPVYNIWFKTGWAAFGWLEVRFPNWTYLLLAVFSVMVLAAAGIAVVRSWRGMDLAIAAFFVVTVVVLLAGLHWVEFRTLVTGAGPFNQGRYLLPLAPLGGAAVAASVSLLRGGVQKNVGAILLAGILALQLFSLALVAGRFYA